jgi:putative membrane protein
MPPEHEETSQEMSRKLVRLAAERTLSAWIRTSLSLMALGFVIDRFGLILHRLPSEAGADPLYPRMLSTWSGSVLVGMGVLMALAAGLRYLHFAIGYRREQSTDLGPSLDIGAWFALGLAAFGIALIVLLVAVLP